MKPLIPLFALLLLAGTLRAQDVTVAAAPDTTPGDGAILARARIPTADNPHGETRLIHRHDGACVQTLLHTTALRRGVHEMLKKESMGWPQGVPGYDDSLAYRAALEAAKQHVLAAADKGTPPGGPLSLLMEVTLSPATATAGYAFYDVSVSVTDGEFLVTNKQLITSSATAAGYVSRAMRLMTAAAFRLPDDELTNLLHRAGWQLIPVTDDGGLAAAEPTR